MTDDSVLGGAAFRSRVGEVLEAGGPRLALHVRGPRTPGRVIWEHAAACARMAAVTGTPVLVNDRLDVALAVGAAGAQLGAASFGIREARSFLGPGSTVGASIHGVREARHAAREGADFVLAGTLYATSSHPDREPSGTAWLRDLRDLGIPVLGIGGISADTVPDVLAAGAHGVAVISAVWRTASPVDAVQVLLALLE